jgi:hypothetical protein
MGTMTDTRYAQQLGGAELAYVSDYLSFVGADSSGRVAFAIDTNRGRDPESKVRRGVRADLLQAAHAYAVLHDERTGWVPLQGAERYPHPGPDVTDLPDSPWFRFAGGADMGWRINSDVNDLSLDVEPLADRLLFQDEATLFVMRSAAATLTWRGRTISGRVIHEGLATTALNLLTRRSFKGLAGLEFLYLIAGSPTDPWGDVYLQKTLPGGGTLAGMPLQTGFVSPGSTAQQSDPADDSLEGLRIDTRSHRPGAGLYRWPTSWSATWTGRYGGRADLSTLTRTTVGQYGVAGFGMSIISGTWHLLDGTSLPLYGFGELLAAGPVLRRLAR